MWRHLIALLLVLAASVALAEDGEPGHDGGPGGDGEPSDDVQAIGATIGRSRWRLGVGWPEGFTYEVGRRSWMAEELFDVPRPFEDAALVGRVGARLDVDATAFIAPQSLGDFQNQVQVRRARFYTKGYFRFDVRTDYHFQFSVEGGDFFLQQAELRWHPDRWGIADVVVGHTTPPMGLDNIESSRAIPFMEMGSPLLALAPSYRTGVRLSGASERWRLAWNAGLFSAGQTQATGDASKAALQPIGRVAWRSAAPDAPSLVHLGLSASFLFSGQDSIQYRSRPESFAAPYVVDTGRIDASDAIQYGLEAAWRHGSRLVQAELLQSFVRGAGMDDVGFWGGYAFANWILTGERRPYDAASGIFGRIVPRQDFRPCAPGWGAVGVSQRVSYLDLTSGQVRGGKMLSATSAVSWYWNAHVRVMFNYVFADVTDGPQEGAANIFESRFEFAF